jgi:hypothetical protein
MKITDELRKWAHGPDEGDDWLDRIDEFCDRIDAAHRSALEKLAAQVLISRDGNAYADTFAFSHHHAPTVEDVLREFADEVQRCCDTQDTIAEYAEKLQLRKAVGHE